MCREKFWVSSWQMNASYSLTGQIIGLGCILLTTTSSLVLGLPWARCCRRRNYFKVKFEETILEQTENILISEMGRAAADAVTKSLLSLSSLSSEKEAPSVIHEAKSAKVTNVTKDENALLNVSANWKHVSYIAGGIIDSISESKAKNEREQQ